MSDKLPSDPALPDGAAPAHTETGSTTTDHGIQSYGWSSAQAAYSCGYLTPQVLRLLRALPVRRVADLGAGNGSLCAHLTAQGYDVVGVENDAAGVAIAQAAHPAIPFYHFGVQDDPAVLMRQEAPFDAVVSTEVIEHLYAPHLLPTYAAQVLTPQGYLIISTPYHGYWKNMALSLLDGWDKHHAPLWHGGHIKFWSRRTLSTLLVRHGFRVVGFTGVGRLPYLWKSMILVAQRMP